MKAKMKYFLLPAMLLALGGCNAKTSNFNSIKSGDTGYAPSGEYEPDPTFSSDGGGYAPYPGGEGGYVGEEGGGAEPSPSPDDSPAETPKYPKAGQLTCKALDDNKYYDYWKTLGYEDEQTTGQFAGYRQQFAFNTYNRLDLTINNGTDVTVKVKGDTFATKVDNLHKAYLFPQEIKQEYEVEISYTDSTDTKQTIERVVNDGDVIDLEDTFTISNNLEIMFVIDATGSMGDEMEYLKSEIDDVIGKVKELNEQANISLALMVYRDAGDEYVTRYSDFSTDIRAQQSWLKGQNSGGGGDIPEAVQTAMDEALSKQWSAKATKLLFHVADAPSHDNDVSSWNQSALLAARKGIKIITVASSGIDLKTEYFFRSQSLLTSGQYVCLTDDSGIGGGHLEATTDIELTVEYLNECLIRLVNGYFTGEFTEPVSWKQSNQ